MPLKRVRLLCVVLFATGVLVQSAYTQEAPKKAAPAKQTASPSEALLKQWNEIGRKLIAMAEDFPENKYDFKAAPGAKTFGERLIHAAAANYYFTNVATVVKHYADIFSILPAQFVTADMVPDKIGTWMFHCHIDEHMESGMMAMYQVTP